jgi:hypothetical protein
MSRYVLISRKLCNGACSIPEKMQRGNFEIEVRSNFSRKKRDVESSLRREENR